MTAEFINIAGLLYCHSSAILTANDNLSDSSRKHNLKLKNQTQEHKEHKYEGIPNVYRGNSSFSLCPPAWENASVCFVLHPKTLIQLCVVLYDLIISRPHRFMLRLRRTLVYMQQSKGKPAWALFDPSDILLSCYTVLSQYVKVIVF